MNESTESKTDEGSPDGWSASVESDLSGLLESEQAELVREDGALHLLVQYDGLSDVFFNARDHYALIVALSVFVPLTLWGLLFFISPESGANSSGIDLLPVMLAGLFSLFVGRPFVASRRQYSVTFEPSFVEINVRDVLGRWHGLDLERDSNIALFVARHTDRLGATGRQLHYGGETLRFKEPFREDDVEILADTIRQHLDLRAEAESEERGRVPPTDEPSRVAGASRTLIVDDEQVRLETIAPSKSTRGRVILVCCIAFLVALPAWVGFVFLGRGALSGAIFAFALVASVILGLVIWLGRSTTWLAAFGDRAIKRKTTWFGTWTRTKELKLASWSVLRIVSRASEYGTDFSVQFESQASSPTLLVEPDPEFASRVANAFAEALDLRVERQT